MLLLLFLVVVKMKMMVFKKLVVGTYLDGSFFFGNVKRSTHVHS